jgi:hypothetical protein
MSSTSDFINASQKLSGELTDRKIAALRMLISTNEMAATFKHNWPDFGSQLTSDGGYDVVSFFDPSQKDPLSVLSGKIASKLNLPPNSVYLHGIACVASAMVKGFTYTFWGESKSPISLYVVVAQPPGATKSSAHNFLCDPIQDAFDQYDEQQNAKKAPLLFKLEDTKKQYKAAEKAGQLSIEGKALSDQMRELKSEIDVIHNYIYSLTDATPELMVNSGLENGGVFNAISDEKSILDGITGGLYGNGKSNNEGILKAFDNGRVTKGRVSTGIVTGRIRGCIGVFAQDVAIQGILEQSALSNGLTERFLFLSEANLIGTRDITLSDRKGVDKSMIAAYTMLMNRLVFTDDCNLTFCDKGAQLILDLKNSYNSRVVDGGDFSSNLLRGASAKLDTKAARIACIFHVLKNWTVNSKSNPTLVDVECIARAVNVCDQLMGVFKKNATDGGYVGLDAECAKVVEKLTAKASRSNYITTPTQLRDLLKNTSIFNGRHKGLSSYIKTEIIPKLELEGYCIVANRKIYINPKLNG